MTGTVLLLLIALLAKHCLADFVLQSAYIIANRRHYGHPGGLLHVAIHGVGSLAAFAIAGVAIGLGVLAIVAIEIAAHYHIDWAKDNLNHKWTLTPDQSRYWHLIGFDQLLHQLTYVAMIFVWASAG